MIVFSKRNKPFAWLLTSLVAALVGLFQLAAPAIWAGEEAAAVAESKAAPCQEGMPCNNEDDANPSLSGKLATSASVQPCFKGEVTYEGGAIGCPACKTAADDYLYNPMLGDEVNGHIRAALSNNLESAKWLISFYSEKGNDNEAEKWFGRALALGADGADLKLRNGYQRKYMTTAYFTCGSSDFMISASCHRVPRNWETPSCYSYVLIIKLNQYGENNARLFQIASTKQYPSVRLDSVTCFNSATDYYLIFQSSSNEKYKNYSRKDYFKGRNSRDNEARRALYLGSDIQDPQVIILPGYQEGGYFPQTKDNKIESKPFYVALSPEKQQEIMDDIKFNNMDCKKFDLSMYPAAPAKVMVPQ